MTQVMRVLIVDDDPSCAKLLSLAITATGVEEVRQENRSDQAAARIKHERPDLVFLDVKMPKVDGFEVLMSVRERGDRVPVVMCSGSSLPADVDRAYANGCNGYLEKPDTLAGYKVMAAKVIDYWRCCLVPHSTQE